MQSSRKPFLIYFHDNSYDVNPYQLRGITSPVLATNIDCHQRLPLFRMVLHSIPPSRPSSQHHIPSPFPTQNPEIPNPLISDPIYTTSLPTTTLPYSRHRCPPRWRKHSIVIPSKEDVSHGHHIYYTGHPQSTNNHDSAFLISHTSAADPSTTTRSFVSAEPEGPNPSARMAEIVNDR